MERQMQQPTAQSPHELQSATQTSQETSQQAGQQAQQPMGQQTMGEMGLRLQDVETQEQRQAIHHVARAVQTCAWCADQCIHEADPNMVECIRLCQDVTELGSTALELVPRQSRYARMTLQTLEQAIQACGQECSRHHHNHCQECAEVLEQAAMSVQQLEQTLVQ